MIICGNYELPIGKRVSQRVATLEKEWTEATFIVEREATLAEMYEQLDGLGYPRENFHPECDYLYYKVLVD
jgi:hypothetical protein